MLQGASWKKHLVSLVGVDLGRSMFVPVSGPSSVLSPGTMRESWFEDQASYQPRELRQAI